MADTEDLRQQLLNAVGDAKYPVKTPIELVPVLPNGPATRFESGEFSMTAMEMNTKLAGGNYPYETPEAFADDLIEQLHDQGLL